MLSSACNHQDAASDIAALLLQVDTLESGEMDYEHFRVQLAANARRPAIVNVNCGTTVKGAVDDLDRVLDILRETGYGEERFYIHVDGALFGMMVMCLRLLQHMRKRRMYPFKRPQRHDFVLDNLPLGSSFLSGNQKVQWKGHRCPHGPCGICMGRHVVGWTMGMRC